MLETRLLQAACAVIALTLHTAVHTLKEVEKKVEAITVPVYGSNADSLTGSNALKDKTLAPGALVTSDMSA
jgi:hypothetical protein